MSMLAERKQKQKWSLNPRGKLWSEDSNKLGQKLLEKMGWSSGKGLGANEDGIVEHIKVKYKNDSQGMGFKESDDQWTEHESKFSKLLNSLSGSAGDEKDVVTKVESLEKKSQTSRARVHYHKFTRGKDLSRYSEKDLANIFGKKSLKETTKNELKNEVKDNDDKNFGIQTHNAGSMLDYFKNKLPVHKKYVVNCEPQPKHKNFEENSESENERPSFGFGFKNGGAKSSFVSYLEENTLPNENNIDTEKKNVEKLKKKKNGLVKIEIEECEEGKEVTKCKKRRITEIVETTEKPCLETCLDVMDTKKQKKNKKKKNSNIISEVAQAEEEFQEVASKSKKRKKVQIEALDNLGFVLEDSVTVSENTNLHEIKRKKKQKNLGIENLGLDQEISSPQEPNRTEKNSKVFVNLELPFMSEEVITKATDELSRETETVVKIQNRQKTVFNDISENIFKDKTEISASLRESNLIGNFADENNELEIKSKKKKKSEKQETVEDQCLENGSDSMNARKEKKSKKKRNLNVIEEVTQAEEDFQEVASKPRKRRKSQLEPTDNLGFVLEDSFTGSDNKNLHEMKQNLNIILGVTQAEEDSQKVASKSKKRKRSQLEALDNLGFVLEDSIMGSENTNLHEIKRKKKPKNLGIENLGLDLEIPSPPKPNKTENDLKEFENLEMPIMDEEVMINVTDKPVPKKETEAKPIYRRKSVRFSDVNESIFIDKTDSPANLRKTNLTGIDNEGYDELGNHLEENIGTLSKELDDYQAEVENDLNEAKMEVMVGEMGDPNGENEILPNGNVKLKFRYANFGKIPPWLRKNGEINSKSSYRHLIKGDIVLGFKNTNLHEIPGYKLSSSAHNV